VSDRSGQHTRSHSCSHLVNTITFHFLIHHVIKPSKESFFNTRSQPSTEEPFDSLFLVNISHGAMDRFILMKISQLKPGFNDVQGVCDDRTDNTCDRRMKKVVAGVLLLFFEVFKGTKK
jgi:hypothetical protein